MRLTPVDLLVELAEVWQHLYGVLVSFSDLF